jgi:hypothetical protein
LSLLHSRLLRFGILIDPIMQRINRDAKFSGCLTKQVDPIRWLIWRKIV